jgi:hypothetical protein
VTVRRLETLETIDWYDGIVLAVLATNWMEGIYLGSLLAFDVELRKRVIALLPLSESDLSEIRSRLGGDWELVLSHLKQLWRQASGRITVLCCIETGERVIAETTVDASDLKDEAVSDVEEAVSKSRMKWFDAFPSTSGRES